MSCCWQKVHGYEGRVRQVRGGPILTSSILPPLAPAASIASCIATIATISGLIPAGGWWVGVGTSGGLQSTVPSSKADTTQDTLASTLYTVTAQSSQL